MTKERERKKRERKRGASRERGAWEGGRDKREVRWEGGERCTKREGEKCAGKGGVKKNTTVYRGSQTERGLISAS